MLIRPTKFFFTEPIICLVSIMSATVFSFIYLHAEGLTVPYHDFGYTERQTSLVYYAWAVGMKLTIPLRVVDWRVVSTKMRQHKAVLPEDKLTGFYIAAPVLAIALWWFAWTTPPRAADVSPFVSISALVLVGAYANEFDALLQGYLTDSYQTYAASANAPLAVLRGVLSGAFPIFARPMFRGLGANVAVSIMAASATVFCGVAVWFWIWGAKVREASPFATKEEKS